MILCSFEPRDYSATIQVKFHGTGFSFIVPRYCAGQANWLLRVCRVDT